jgi:hypothetical protein
LERFPRLTLALMVAVPAEPLKVMPDPTPASERVPKLPIIKTPLMEEESPTVTAEVVVP